MLCMIENRGLFMENNIIEESGLKFQFPKNDTVIKFDDTKFYRDYFNKLPEAKGVDFISVDKNKIAFIEVKNCTGDEGNCRWRIAPNNQNAIRHTLLLMWKDETVWILKWHRKQQ